MTTPRSPKLKNPPVTALPNLVVDRRAAPPAEDRIVCERCGRANLYRMHAVWRCADCGYKTDCCGW